MTATLDGVTKKKAEPTAEQAAALELVRLAKEQGLSLTGPDGLLKQLTKTVLETSLNEEMTEHLGHEEARPGRRRDRQYPQRHEVEDGADRAQRSGRDRGAARSGRHVRAADREEATTAIERRG